MVHFGQEPTLKSNTDSDAMKKFASEQLMSEQNDYSSYLAYVNQLRVEQIQAEEKTTQQYVARYQNSKPVSKYMAGQLVLTR